MRRGTDIIKSLNEKFMEEKESMPQTPEERREAESLKKLEKLSELKKEKKEIRFYIDHVSTDGIISYTDEEGITYILTPDKLKKVYPEYSQEYAGFLLGSSFYCTISSINKKDKTVSISNISKGSMEKGLFTQLSQSIQAVNSTYAFKGLLNSTIGKQNRNKEKILVKGVVTKVLRDVCYIDMYGTGVIGAIPAMHFRKRFTSDMRDHVRVGDVLKGIVIEYRPPVRGEKACYIINASEYIALNQQKYKDIVKIRDVFIVKCIHKPDQKERTFYWAITPLLPGIDILCDYSTSVPREKVEVGRYYRVSIRKVEMDETKGVLMVSANSFGIAKGPDVACRVDTGLEGLDSSENEENSAAGDAIEG